MKIDVHAPLFPRPFLAELERRKLEFRLPGMPFSIFPKMYDLDERLADMATAGIDMQALSLGPPGAEVGTAGDSVDLTRLYNDLIAQVVQADPRHFTGLAALPMQWRIPGTSRDWPRFPCRRPTRPCGSWTERSMTWACAAPRSSATQQARRWTPPSCGPPHS